MGREAAIPGTEAWAQAEEQRGNAEGAARYGRQRGGARRASKEVACM